ncbi:response regulator [Salinibius halmophilus]|uniref:response regulator n=1 Tax=Salinibius halmophilus TaxID=1853216 RepID=UPI000E676720|nr:response regulator [Salinibius halmophilus]
MNILIVEDQDEKYSDIKNFLENEFSPSVLDHARSIRSALKLLITNERYELVILDMSMPSFDPDTSSAVGESPKSFGGIEVLTQIKIRDIKTSVIVITQYSKFDEGSISLGDLNSKLSNDFENLYLGGVFYSSISREWKSELRNIIRRV